MQGGFPTERPGAVKTAPEGVMTVHQSNEVARKLQTGEVVSWDQVKELLAEYTGFFDQAAFLLLTMKVLADMGHEDKLTAYVNNEVEGFLQRTGF